MRSLRAGAFLLAVLCSSSALAQEPASEPVTRPRSRGTHFIAEPFAGSHIQGAGSFAWGGFVGYGGKPRGTPLRFYILAGFMRSSDHRTGYVSDPPVRTTYDLGLTDVDAGVRMVVPLVGPLRLSTELMLGASIADASLMNASVGTTHQNHADPHLMLGIGPQLRILNELSVGVLARTTFTDVGEIRSDGALSGWKDSLGRRSVIVGTLSFHW